MDAESEWVADILHGVDRHVGKHNDLLLGLDSANDLGAGTDTQLTCRSSGKCAPLCGVFLVRKADRQRVLHTGIALGVTTKGDDVTVTFRHYDGLGNGWCGLSSGKVFKSNRAGRETQALVPVVDAAVLNADDEVFAVVVLRPNAKLSARNGSCGTGVPSATRPRTRTPASAVDGGVEACVDLVGSDDRGTAVTAVRGIGCYADRDLIGVGIDDPRDLVLCVEDGRCDVTAETDCARKGDKVVQEHPIVNVRNLNDRRAVGRRKGYCASRRSGPDRGNVVKVATADDVVFQVRADGGVDRTVERHPSQQ